MGKQRLQNLFKIAEFGDDFYFDLPKSASIGRIGLENVDLMAKVEVILTVQYDFENWPGTVG